MAFRLPSFFFKSFLMRSRGVEVSSPPFRNDLRFCATFPPFQVTLHFSPSIFFFSFFASREAQDDFFPFVVTDFSFFFLSFVLPVVMFGAFFLCRPSSLVSLVLIQTDQAAFCMNLNGRIYECVANPLLPWLCAVGTPPWPEFCFFLLKKEYTGAAPIEPLRRWSSFLPPFFGVLQSSPSRFRLSFRRSRLGSHLSTSQSAPWTRAIFLALSGALCSFGLRLVAPLKYIFFSLSMSIFCDSFFSSSFCRFAGASD